MFVFFRGGVTWPLKTPKTDRAPLISKYSEEDKNLFDYIYLEHLGYVSPYIFKNTIEASLMGVTIKSSNPLPIVWVSV